MTKEEPPDDYGATAQAAAWWSLIQNCSHGIPSSPGECVVFDGLRAMLIDAAKNVDMSNGYRVALGRAMKTAKTPVLEMTSDDFTEALRKPPAVQVHNNGSSSVVFALIEGEL